MDRARRAEEREEKAEEGREEEGRGEECKEDGRWTSTVLQVVKSVSATKVRRGKVEGLYTCSGSAISLSTRFVACSISTSSRALNCFSIRG